jgi:hypothetical protein
MTALEQPAPRARAIDSLVNSSFLNPDAVAGLRHLFKEIDGRPAIETAEDLLARLDAADIGAAVVSIMEPAHAEVVANAHSQYPNKRWRPESAGKESGVVSGEMHVTRSPGGRAQADWIGVPVAAGRAAGDRDRSVRGRERR